MLKKRKIVIFDEDFKFCIFILKYFCDFFLFIFFLGDAIWWSRGLLFVVEDCWEGLEVFFLSDFMFLISFLVFVRFFWVLFILVLIVVVLEFLIEGRREKIKIKWKNGGNLNNVKYGYGVWI